MATATLEKRSFTSTFQSVPGLDTQIDEVAGIIRGVAVITEGQPVDARVDKASGLPIFIDRTTLQQVCDTAQAYEGGLKVKADHGSGIFAVTGYLKNFRVDIGADGLARTRADLFVLASDPNKAKLFEMAQKIPDTFGLSISCGGLDENRGDRMLLRCEEIYSADLVPEPAANPTGLFSSQVDANRKNNSQSTMAEKNDTPAAPSPADILKQCSDMIAAHSAKMDDMSKAFAAHQKSMAEMAKHFDSKGDGVTGNDGANGGEKPAPKDGPENYSALRAQITTLSANFDGLKKELESVPARLAKEFASSVGTSPARSGAADAGQATAAAGKPEDRFEQTVQKHFAATHSKTKAMSAAIKEDQPGYDAFMSSGRKAVKYA